MRSTYCFALYFVLSFRHNCYASSIRNGSTSRQSERGTFGSASSDENGHVVETHRSWHVGYTAATSRQPSSVGDFPQVAHAKFQRSIAVERIYQLSATVEKRSDHHWRIFQKSKEFKQHDERRYVIQPPNERRPVEATLSPKLRLIFATGFEFQKSVWFYIFWRVKFSSVRSGNASTVCATTAPTTSGEWYSFQLSSDPATKQPKSSTTASKSASLSSGVFSSTQWIRRWRNWRTRK